MSIRLTTTVALAAGLMCTQIGTASAWDLAPWGGGAWDQPLGLSAQQRAMIARSEASAAAQPAQQRQRYGNVVSAGRTCNVAIGNVAAPARGNGNAAFSNVQINGDVINICR
jgi:hypothetical protein